MQRTNKLFTIGQVAKLCGISVKTLRYYQQVGLLEPEIVDRDNGFRYYSEDQIGLLSIIIGLKYLDYNISEIKEFFKHKHLDFLEKKLSEKIQYAEDEIIRLAQYKKKLEYRLELFEKARLLKKRNKESAWQPELRILPARKMISIGGKALPTLGEISQRFINIIHLAQKNSVVLEEHFLRFHESYSEIERSPINFEACCIVGELYHDCSILKPLPENLYVVFPFEGKWIEFFQLYQKIGSWFLTHPYHPVGPVEMVFLESYFHTREKNHFSADIQIPVQKNPSTL